MAICVSLIASYAAAIWYDWYWEERSIYVVWIWNNPSIHKQRRSIENSAERRTSRHLDKFCAEFGRCWNVYRYGRDPRSSYLVDEIWYMVLRLGDFTFRGISSLDKQCDPILSRAYGIRWGVGLLDRSRSSDILLHCVLIALWVMTLDLWWFGINSFIPLAENHFDMHCAFNKYSRAFDI